MFKILIADDEYLIRMGLKSMLDWQKLDCTIVGEAKSGKETLLLFEQTDPDILIADIKMGTISGIDVVKELKNKKKQLKTIILTHYDDFAFAKEAFKNGADEYILKHDLSPESLEKVIKDICLKLSDGKNQLNDNEHSIISDNLDSIFSNLINNFSSGNKINDNMLETYSKDCFLVCVAKIFINFDSQMLLDMNSHGFYKSVSEVLLEIMRNKGIKLAFIGKENLMHILICFKKAKADQIDLNEIISCLTLCRNNINQIFDIEMLMGISDIFNKLSIAPVSVQEAEIALEYSFFGSEIYSYSSIDSDCNRYIDIAKSESPSLKVMWKYLKEQDKKGLCDYISRIFDSFENKGNICEFKHVFNDFMGCARMIVKDMGATSLTDIAQKKLNYANIDSLCGLKAVKRYVVDLFMEFIDAPCGILSGGYSYHIRKCIEFIEKNYANNITLGDCASYAEISKSYLSMLFKQELGINFNIFLSKYRVERSKELLISTNMKVYEIAQAVGFDNPYYFSKVFKDITGITCKEFKINNDMLEG